MNTRRYAYYYAIIDLETGMCVEVQDTSDYVDSNEYPEYIMMDVYDEGLLEKYYYNGKWYYDTTYQTEYIPVHQL